MQVRKVVQVTHLTLILLLSSSQFLQLAQKLLPCSCLNISYHISLLDYTIPKVTQLPEDQQGSGQEEQRELLPA